MSRAFPLLLLALLFAMACQKASPPVFPEEDSPEIAELRGLSAVFYSLVINRRFDSIATYRNPALREFFQSDESFSDYYADLAQALTLAYFRANRAHSGQVRELIVDEPNRVRVEVEFAGENARPLRWWDVHLVREDQWQRKDGRWWIVPGKL